jgi:Amt family ammonium transporter
MKRMIALLALFGAFTLATPAMADDKPAAPVAAAADAAAPTAPVAPAVAPAAATPTAAEAAPAAPVPPNKGDTAWMIVATLLVIMMAVPGLPLFYGGMVRSKNMLSIMMQVMVTFSLLGVLWCM